MAELDPTRNGDIRTRVEDYLNDKFQTSADLEQVDGLLLRVQEQQELLKKQVRLMSAMTEVDPNDKLARYCPTELA